MTGLRHWTPRQRPTNAAMAGRWTALEPVSATAHAADLWTEFGGADNPQIWTHILDGPFPDRETFQAWLQRVEARQDWVSFAILPAATGRPAGIANYMRIDEANGSAEVGCIMYGSGLARSAAATEAMLLMARRIFDEFGYRRYEWKCDADNRASRRAAERLGFTYEGTFRRHMVVKGRNRDTAWYAIIDREWPAIRTALEQWLEPANFHADGMQVTRLGDLIERDHPEGPLPVGELPVGEPQQGR